MTSPKTSGGTPASDGGHGGGTGGPSVPADRQFLPPLVPIEGMSSGDSAALAAENARRAERGRALLASVGPQEARFRVYAALLHAATDDVGNLVRLFDAVRDARELHPDGDARRIAPLPAPYPTDELDSRNDAARTVAYRVLEGAEQLPESGELLTSLDTPRPDRAPPSDGVPFRDRRRLAEVVEESLDWATESSSAGWPTFVVPWEHAWRERTAVLLIGKARAAARVGGDPSRMLASLSAVVLLERDSRERGWRETTWDALRAFVTESALAPLASAVLREAIEAARHDKPKAMETHIDAAIRDIREGKHAARR